MMVTNFRQYSSVDRCILQFDQMLRTLAGRPISSRVNPTENISESKLLPEETQESIRLMRVNHSGEVSAQALYHAQAIVSHSEEVRHAMQEARIEENDHLAWCQQRLEELGGHTSYLNPFWYLGSFFLGALAGLAGDAWNLGFLAETEQQVVEHLDDHLQRLPASDAKSAAILAQMRDDEAHHASVALMAGASELPELVKTLMKGFSKIMTQMARWI